MDEPWGIAVRISRARDGSTLGVERQEPPCRALVERLGGQVVKVYTRNDVSGFSGDFPFADALADLRAGRIRGTLRGRPTGSPAGLGMRCCCWTRWPRLVGSWPPPPANTT
jgi:hypothetical protein